LLQIFQSNNKNFRWDLNFFSFGGVAYSLNKKVHYALFIKFQMAIGYGKQLIQVGELQSLVADILSFKRRRGGWTKKRNRFQVQKIRPDLFFK
jgi:hypothetical protein